MLQLEETPHIESQHTEGYNDDTHLQSINKREIRIILVLYKHNQNSNNSDMQNDTQDQSFS